MKFGILKEEVVDPSIKLYLKESPDGDVNLYGVDEKGYHFTLLWFSSLSGKVHIIYPGFENINVKVNKVS